MSSKICETHTWDRDQRKTVSESCFDCGEVFPCKGNTCHHVDCEEERQKAPKCFLCKKEIKESNRCFINAKGVNLHPVHARCGGDKIVFEVGYSCA